MQEVVEDAGLQNLVNTLFGEVPANAQSDFNNHPDLEIPLLQCFQKVLLQLSIHPV